MQAFNVISTLNIPPSFIFPTLNLPKIPPWPPISMASSICPQRLPCNPSLASFPTPPANPRPICSRSLLAMLLIPLRAISSAVLRPPWWHVEVAVGRTADPVCPANHTEPAEGTGCPPLYPSPPDMDRVLYNPYGDPSHGDELSSHTNFRYQNGGGKLVTQSQKNVAIVTLKGTDCTAFGIAESNTNWNIRHQAQFKSSATGSTVNLSFPPALSIRMLHTLPTLSLAAHANLSTAHTVEESSHMAQTTWVAGVTSAWPSRATGTCSSLPPSIDRVSKPSNKASPQ
jgi:hypothetical protein